MLQPLSKIFRYMRFRAIQRMVLLPVLILASWFCFDYTISYFILGINVKNPILTIVSRYLVLTLVFMIQYLCLFQRFFMKDKVKLYVLFSFLLVLGMPLIDSLAEYWYGPTGFYPNKRDPKINYVNGMYNCIIYWALSFGYSYAIYHIRAERKRSRSASSKQKIEQLKNEFEKSKIASELNFLKLQINPHFLYNALNTFYAQALPLSMPLANGLLTLSNIMRYAVEGSKSDARVSLSREVDHIKNLIEIQKLRFGHRFYMKVEIEGYIETKQIPPLIFITFIENVFKHGEIHDAENPAEVKIFASPYDIIFITRNKKKVDGHKEPSTHVGLKNTLQRLNAYYPERFDLETKDEGDYYSVKLKIKT